MNKKFALCVGINDYPGSGNDLYGCVNDANNWANLLTQEGYDVTRLTDNQATRFNVTAQLTKMVEKARFADRIVFTYSGHGSWVPDNDGDEADGRDECLVLHDWQNSGYLRDDDLYRIWQHRRFGVRTTTFSDSCFSGTVSRLLDPQHRDAVGAKPRFFDPDLLKPGATRRRLPQSRNLTSRTGTVLFSGCRDDEVSWDAYIEGQQQGAFSYIALKAYDHGINMRDWYKRISGLLPFGAFTQHPQLTVTSWQKRWKL